MEQALSSVSPAEDASHVQVPAEGAGVPLLNGKPPTIWSAGP